MSKVDLKDNEGMFGKFIFLIDTFGSHETKKTSSNMKDQMEEYGHLFLSKGDNPISLSGVFIEDDERYGITAKSIITDFTKNKSDFLKIGNSLKVECICKSFEWDKKGNLFEFRASFMKKGKYEFPQKKKDNESESIIKTRKMTRESEKEFLKSTAMLSDVNEVKKPTQKEKMIKESIIKDKSLLDNILEFSSGCVADVMKVINKGRALVESALNVRDRINDHLSTIYKVTRGIASLVSGIKDILSFPRNIAKKIAALMDSFKRAFPQKNERAVICKKIRKYLEGKYDEIPEMISLKDVLSQEETLQIEKKNKARDIKLSFLNHLMASFVSEEINTLVSSVYERDGVTDDKAIEKMDGITDGSNHPLLSSDHLISLPDIIRARDELLNALDKISYSLNNDSIDLRREISNLKSFVFYTLPPDSNDFPNVKIVNVKGVHNPLELCHEFYGSLNSHKIFSARNNFYDELLLNDPVTEVLNSEAN